MVTINFVRVCNFEGTDSAIKPGMEAELLIVDLERIMENPWVFPNIYIIDLIFYRGRGDDVNTVIVNGIVLIKNHKFCNIEVGSLYSEVREQIKKDPNTKQEEFAETLHKLKPFV